MDQESYERFRDSWWPIAIAGIIGIITVIRSYVGGEDCPTDNKIQNKVVLITGASTGIGLQTAKELAKRGAKIILTCRNIEKGKEAKKAVLYAAPKATILVKYLDISDIQGIKEFVTDLTEYNVIDILINNAGIMCHPHEITREGFETHFVTNYLGHFTLTHLLLPKLRASENGRIINIASQAYASGHINFNDLNLVNAESDQNIQAFSQSKLGLVLMTRHMSKLLEGTRVTINVMDPGLTRNTNHMERSPLKASIPVRLSVWPWMWLFLRTPKQASQTIIYLAVDPKLTKTTGKYFKNCEQKELAENCKDENIDGDLYRTSCKLAKIEPLANVTIT